MGEELANLSDAEFLREVMALLGPMRSGRLVLFCLYWAATGRKTFGQVARHEERLGPERWGYRAYSDLRLLRDRLAELGGQPVDVVKVAERVVRVGSQDGGEVLTAAAR